MSDSSDLSEVPSDIEDSPSIELSEPVAPPLKTKTLKLKQGKLDFSTHKHVPREPTPEAPPREPSPPHDYVLADNPDIAFLIMFRHRFAEAFSRNVPNLGPQDLEQGVVETPPSAYVGNLLCALLGLVLNRKKEVERGHHSRALEEAISSNKTQWPSNWNGTNPLPGQRSFIDLDPEGRLHLLRALALWSLNSSDLIKDIIATSYKQTRKEDDLNQPLAVQPWGTDSRKRKYWLIEGQSDTAFRIYKQNLAAADGETWWSVASSLDELRSTADELRMQDGSQAAKRLADRMELAIPRLEESEEKRRRKEYRQARKAAFVRPEPGFSLYEGRTRGVRQKYTFSDDEGDGSDVTNTRRGNRHSDRSTPIDPNAPTMTSSGRQVRSRFGRSYGDAIGRRTSEDGSHGRRTRGSMNGAIKADSFDASSEDADSGEDAPSGDDWQGDDYDNEGRFDKDEDDELSDGGSDDSLMKEPRSLLVTLRYRIKNPNHPPTNADPAQDSKPTNGLPPPAAKSTSGTAPTPKSIWPSHKSKSASAASPSRPISASSSGKAPPVFKPDPYGPYNPHATTPMPLYGHQGFPGQPNQHGPLGQQSPQPQAQGAPLGPPEMQYPGPPHSQQPGFVPRGSPYGFPPQHSSHGPPPHQSPSYGYPPPQHQYPQFMPAYPPSGPPHPGWHGQQPPGPPIWQQPPMHGHPQPYQPQ